MRKTFTWLVQCVCIASLFSHAGCATVPQKPAPDWTLKKERNAVPRAPFQWTRESCVGENDTTVCRGIFGYLEFWVLPVELVVDLFRTHYTYYWIPPEIPKPKTPARLSTEVLFSEPSGNNILDASEIGTLDVSVTNSGAGPAYGVSLMASVEGVSGLHIPTKLDLGEIQPGKTKIQRITLDADQKLSTGKASVKIEAREANGFDAAPRIVEFETLAFKAPKLEIWGLSIGGGVVRAGDVAQLEVTVKNSGAGPASKVSASLEIKDKDIFPSGDTTAALGTIEPGRTAKARFDFVVNMRFKGKTLPINFNLIEAWGKYGTSTPLELVLGEPPPLPKVLTVQTKTQALTPQAVSGADNLAAPPYQLKERPADFALVVGIDKYQTLPSADFADRDATAVRAQLIAMGFPQRNIVFLTRDKATRSNFASYIEEWLPKNVQSESTVFVYFSGHGASDQKAGDSYLVPWDGNPQFLHSTAYPLKQLYAALSKLKAKEVTVALDSCFSGTGGRSVMAKGARPMVNVNAGTTPAGNLTVFSAASGAEITGSLDEAGHGIFTFHFLNGLSGAAKDSSGQITAKGLLNYLSPRVQEDARRQNREQTPGLSGVGDRVLIRLGQ